MGGGGGGRRGGDYHHLEPEIELGSLTAIIGYVGEVKFNNFTNPNQDRVMRFKVHMCLFTPVLAVYITEWLTVAVEEITAISCDCLSSILS